MAELGLAPDAVFDTELAGRLLGRPRVGLAAMVAADLGLALAKEHSAADWSTRPLPEDWLRYAALDVEVLVELRDVLEAELAQAGKLEWAHQEFEAVRLAPPPPPRIEPWRRTSGITAVRDPRRLAVVRELWQERDYQAQHIDVSPGRLLPDRAIMAAAQALPKSKRALSGLPEFRGKGTQRRLAIWWGAVERALALAERDLPGRRPPRGEGPPSPRSWNNRFPEAAERLQAVRTQMRHIAAELGTPQENVLAPDHQRRLAWEPPQTLDAEAVGAALLAVGARPWQADVTAEALAQALRDPGSVPAFEDPTA